MAHGVCAREPSSPQKKTVICLVTKIATVWSMKVALVQREKRHFATEAI
jgi:hypothetical protein